MMSLSNQITEYTTEAEHADCEEGKILDDERHKPPLKVHIWTT